MSYEQNPPDPFPLNPIYNPNDWQGSRQQNIDIAFLDDNYLKFNTAQGTENLQAINVNGVSEFKRPLNMSDTTLATNRTINSSFYNFYNSGVAGTLTSNGTLHNQNGSMFLQNTTNGGTINFVVNDAGGVQNTPLQLLTTGNLSNRPLTISANNNFTMNAGTGRINQTITTGEVSTRNQFKLSDFTFNSNVGTGGATAFEFFDSVNGKGLFILPNSGNGSLSQTNRQNDCVLSSRSTENTNSIVISNWNTNMRNGLRVSTTDISNCSVQLQCGQNNTNDYTEFRMAYDRSGNLTTTTFNNVINFNPPTATGLPNAISASRRRLEGLGTLSFTDISGNTASGSTTSVIYTDSSGNMSNPTTPSSRGMFYDCSINNGTHNFRGVSIGTKQTFFTIGSTTRCYTPFSFNQDTSIIGGRDILEVGTIEFRDLSQNSTFRSSIHTTSTGNYGNNKGMFYGTQIRGGGHNFLVTNNDGDAIIPFYLTPTEIVARESLNFTSTAVADRNIGKVGTLSFLDLSANSTEGTTLSNIYTDSSLVSSIGGMYYQNNINGGYHIFQARDNTGVLTSPIYYGSNITSVSNTFIVRSSIEPSNRFDILTNNAASTNIRARTALVSTNAQITIGCDSVDASGVVTNASVLGLFPTNINVRRPIQFGYLTTPNASTQLGFQTGPTNITSSAFSSATTERNFSSFTIANAGMYNVSVTLILSGNASHTLTDWRYCLDASSSTFPSTSTPTKFTMSIRGNPPVNLDTSTTSYFNTTFNVLATTNEVYYINFKMVFAGGGTTNIGAVYSYTRIG